LNIKIATRKSPLALWQTQFISDKLKENNPGLTTELIELTTKGDKILDTPLAKVGGKGLFVKELENNLLSNESDIAVHSMKDVPMELPSGLIITCIIKREDPRDAFISNQYQSIHDLPNNAVVGTSSLRRQCQLLALRPDLNIKWLRGNINTRLKKLDNNEYDAIILAAAGIKRMGWENRISSILDTSECLPAVGQGAIGIETLSTNQTVNKLLSPHNHAETAYRLMAERALNKQLNGGCQVPIAGHATINNNNLELNALVGQVDGKKIIKASITGSVSEAEALGRELGNELISKGAKQILDSITI
jgi:hydroxymethylbilane synthase